MNNKKWALFTLSVLGSSLAFAQNGKDSIVKQLDQVEVTATKYPIKQGQTGKVVIIIPHDEIERSGGKSLSQLLTEQPGITIPQAYTDAGTNQSVSIRGAGSGRALFLVDGVPVGDPTQTDNSFDINLIPVSMIDRIEISKGAQSTLYGSDAIAGVINIITIKPNVKTPFNANASLSGGNYGTFNGAAQVYGNVADRLTYNVRYNHSLTNGFSRAYDSAKTVAAGTLPFDHDGYRSDNVAANIGFNATKELTLKAFAQYSNYKTDLDASAFTDARNYTGGNKNLMLGGGFVYTLPNTTIHGNYLYNTTDRLLNKDSVNDQSYSHDHYRGTSQYVELYASTSLGYGFTWLNGADYRYSSMNENGIYGTYPSTFTDTSASQTSMYSSLLYSGQQGFSVELGGRLNTHSRYGSNYTYTFNPAYLVTSNWKIYGSIASGFKAPSLYQLFSSYGDPSLLPERSTSFEGGLQYSNKAIESRVTWFHRHTKDAIDFNNITYQYFNRNEEKGQGIEWEGKIRPTRFLTISTNYTWTKIRQQGQSHQTYDDTSYNYALRTPEHMINFTVGVTPVKNLLLSVSGHYESKRYDLGGYDPITYNALPDVALNSYFILNAYGEYRICKGIKVFADGKNLLNKKFFTVYGYNSIPPMFVGGATFEF